MVFPLLESSTGSVHTLPPVLLLSSLASSPLSSFICRKCENFLMLGFGPCLTAFCKQTSSNSINSQIIISRPSSVWCLNLTVHILSQSLNSLQDRAYDLPLPQTHLSPGLPIYQASSKVRNLAFTPELPSPSPSTARTSARTHPVTLSTSYPPPMAAPVHTAITPHLSLYPSASQRSHLTKVRIPAHHYSPGCSCSVCSWFPAINRVPWPLQPQPIPGLCNPNPFQGLLFCFPARYTVSLHTSPLSCIACLKHPPLTPMACPQAKQAHRITFWIDAARVWNYRQPSISTGLPSTEWITHRSKYSGFLFRLYWTYMNFYFFSLCVSMVQLFIQIVITYGQSPGGDSKCTV